jgi:hypothetical protein
VDKRFYGKTDCAPYLCTGNGCGSSCATSSACAKGFVCDKTGHCVVEEAAPAAPEGCAVTTSAAGSGGALALAFAALVASLRRLRARRLDVHGRPR